MNTVKFLSHLRSLGIKLTLDGSRLRIKAPKGVITPDLKKEMGAQKEDIIRFLKSAQTSLGEAPDQESPTRESPQIQLSHEQQNAWLLHHFGEQSGAGNFIAGVWITGPVNFESLGAALRQFTQEQDLLRASYPLVDGVPSLNVNEETISSLKVFNLRMLPEDNRESMALERACEYGRQQFSLEKGPLHRTAAFRVSDEKCLLSTSLHPMIGDRLSAQILIKVTLEYYARLLKGETLGAGEVSQYSAYADHQKDWLKSEAYKQQWRFWKERLEGKNNVFELASDHPRPLVLKMETRNVSFHLSESEAAPLREIAEEMETDLSNVLMAAFAVHLHKYSDQESIPMGILTPNRKDPFNQTPGPFENTLCIRVNLTKDMDFKGVVSSLATDVAAVKKHDGIPFARLVEDFRGEKDLSRNPLCQICFNVEEEVSWPTVDGHVSSSGNFRMDYSPFDLTLHAKPVGGGIDFRMQYNRSLFSEDRMVRMSGYLKNILTGVKAADSEKHVSALPFLPESEMNQVLVEWNKTERDTAGPHLLHEFFEFQAAQDPEATALIFEDDDLSYGELNIRANRLANKLRSENVCPGDLVGIYLERSFELVVGLLGILKAGGAYVPLDPSYPQERLTFISKNARISTLITRTGFSETLPQHNCKVIHIDDESQFSNFEGANPEHVNSPENPAYVMFTSGSTGMPKGVQNSHRAICSRIHWMNEAFPLGHVTPVLFKMPFSFDASVCEIFWTLASGAPLVIARQGNGHDPEYLVDLIANHNVVVSQFVPQMLENFLDAATVEKCVTLKTVICGGEVLTSKLRDRFFKCIPHASLINCYGPTEAAVVTTFWKCDPDSSQYTIPIGKPISNTQVYILNSLMQPVPIGVVGEIYIGGMGLADGYIDQNNTTDFLPNPFSDSEGSRLYKTGDLARYFENGVIEYLGRKDQQVKVRGLRVELGEIESLLAKRSDIQEARVLEQKDESGKKYLVAYFTSSSDDIPETDTLHAELAKMLPDYMAPVSFVPVSGFPLTTDGKLDRRALPKPQNLGKTPKVQFPRAYSEVERIIAQVWREVLQIDQVDLHDNFFDIGGSSLKMVQVYDRLPSLLKGGLRPIDLLKFPTIRSLDLFIENQEEEKDFFTEKDNYLEEIERRQEELRRDAGLKIAVVGMSCRTPGADSPTQLWKNLRDGVESITFFSVEELKAEGVDPELLADTDYVRAKGVLQDIKGFDAGFFDFTPREAQITDPQHRLFLECAYEALESAGYAPEKNNKRIGVYGGAGNNHYLEKNINANPRIRNTVGELPILIGNDKDNLCARISFKLGLTGPSIGLQTACSTSLVAIHLACQGLLTHDCDMALAGGVALRALEREGYLYEEGLLQPPDGHTRAFDAKAQGSVPSQGAGMVALKRMEDAIADGDHIYAVIKGSAVNNDGMEKAGYTAYGVTGQESVIEAALRSASLEPEDITYVETSSSASPMGDPIEIESLTRVFRKKTDKKAICGVGAIKPNLGAMDIAAGAAAFIKLALSLKHGEIPPSIFFDSPNPKIDFDNSPFFVNAELTEWKSENLRRGGVSGFGLGGTNAHIILEEPPETLPSVKARPWQLINLSAKTPTALETMTERLVQHLKANPSLNFSDVSYTLQVGRGDYKYRRMVVCQNIHEAIIELEKRDPRFVFTAVSETQNRPIAFMFPGQGDQYMNMGQQLYQVDLTYREEVDRCWAIVKEQFPELYGGLSEKDRRSRTEKVHQTYITQLSLFIVEYAMARVLMKWGVVPQAMIGNSTGEYVAACLAGVFSLEDALKVVIGRGRLMQELPPGEMAAVGLSEEELLPYLSENVSLAGVASPKLCMISGTRKGVHEIRNALSKKGVVSRPLFAPHAFHSYMVEPIVPRFAEMISQVKLNPPKIPFISTTTGTWITDDEATDRNYWARQQRQTVRFAQGVDVLFQEANRILVEVGPGKTLSSLATQSASKTIKHLILATMRQPQEDISDVQHLLTTIGRLWIGGKNIDWASYHSDKFRHRVPLPTYPFERDAHWIEAPKQTGKESLDLASDQIQTVPEPQMDHFRPNVNTGFVAPQDPLEQAIAQFWKEFLGLEQIGIHDDFFELGGSSLIAVRLINQMSKKFGVPLASHVLLQKRTIATLAELIKENRSNPEAAAGQNTPLVEIQRGIPGKHALYMVHPIGGEIYFYRDIAHYLGPQQPVYGFQAPSLTGDTEAFTDIIEQAAAYNEALLKHQPKGPFLLGGASYGGNVAYEMAHQLIAKGHEVSLLVVVDSPAPGQMPSKFTDTASILEYLLGDKLELDLDLLRGMSPEDQMSYIFERARLANRVDVLPPSLGIPLFKTWMGHQTALHSYEPKPYPGRVVFFRPTERMKVNPPKMYLPWIDMVKGGIEIHQVGGNHITMNFGDNAKRMAKYLQRTLRSIG